MFAIVFAALVGNNWFQHPTPMPAIVFGVVTVLAPFAIMQPAFGFRPRLLTVREWLIYNILQPGSGRADILFETQFSLSLIHI